MIAIHNSKSGFHPRWVEYCKKNNIPYKIVNAYDTNIIEQLADCDAFMWHHNHINYKDTLFAKQLLYSLQMTGKKVFPDFNTGWHFDDKVGQKYLLEAIKSPLVPSYVFYTKKEASYWANNTDYPKVFKLRGGAGSSNVQLVRNGKQAIKLIYKAFNSGFKQYNGDSLSESWRKLVNKKGSLINVMKSLGHLFIPTNFARLHPKEKGYVYFQDFMPNNEFDIRIVVIGKRAFALKRLVRKNDFRASGGGTIIYHKNEIDERCIKIAFEVNERLNCQSIAYDFVFDEENNPLIVEISYGYSVAAYDLCEGYWTKDMQWHAGTHFDFCGWMIEGILNDDK